MGLFDKSGSHKILTPQERRIKTLEKLKKQKIAVNEHLPLLPPGEIVKLNHFFFGTSIAACIMVLKKNKAENEEGK